jgi:hypothetical protein
VYTKSGKVLQQTILLLKLGSYALCVYECTVSIYSCTCRQHCFWPGHVSYVSPHPRVYCCESVHGCRQTSYTHLYKCSLASPGPGVVYIYASVAVDSILLHNTEICSPVPYKGWLYKVTREHVRQTWLSSLLLTKHTCKHTCLLDWLHYWQ